MYQSPRRRKTIFLFWKKWKEKIKLKLHFLLFAVERYWSTAYKHGPLIKRGRETETKKIMMHFDRNETKRTKKNSTFYSPASHEQSIHKVRPPYSRCISILTRHIVCSAFRRSNNYCVFAAFVAIADFSARGHTSFPIFVRRTRWKFRACMQTFFCLSSLLSIAWHQFSMIIITFGKQVKWLKYIFTFIFIDRE